MYCHKCGIKLNEDALFCHKCGVEVFNEDFQNKSIKNDEQPDIIKNYEVLAKSYYTKDRNIFTAIIEFIIGLVLILLVMILGIMLPNAIMSLCIAIGFLIISSGIVISPRSLYRIDKFLALSIITCVVFGICLIIF